MYGNGVCPICSITLLTDENRWSCECKHAMCSGCFQTAVKNTPYVCHVCAQLWTPTDSAETVTCMTKICSRTSALSMSDLPKHLRQVPRAQGKRLIMNDLSFFWEGLFSTKKWNARGSHRLIRRTRARWWIMCASANLIDERGSQGGSFLFSTKSILFLIAATMTKAFQIYEDGIRAAKGAYEAPIGSASMAASPASHPNGVATPVLSGRELDWKAVSDLLSRAGGITHEDYVRRMLCIDDERMEYRCVYDADLIEEPQCCLPKKKRYLREWEDVTSPDELVSA